MLAGLLNSIPGYVIRGENYNFVYALFKSYNKIMDSKNLHGGEGADNVTDPWWGVNEVDTQEYISDLKTLVDNVLLGKYKCAPRVYGFKEIRYPWVSQNGQLEDYLLFIKRLYPKSCFIFNYRNHEEVMKSGWWASRSDQEHSEGITRMIGFEEQARKFSAENPTFTFETNYEDYSSKLIEIERMFDFLGESFDEERVKAALSIQYSYDNRKNRDSDPLSPRMKDASAVGYLKKLFSKD